MPEENNPSGGTSATQTPPIPVTGTPASSGATPQPKPALTLEEALKRLSDLEHSQQNASEELERHRKNAKRFADLEKAETERQQAQMTEQEKLQKERDELQATNEDLAAEILEHRVNQDISKLASKFNFTISSDLISKLLEWSEIEWDEENGKPLNIEKLLEKLAKSAPELVKPAQQQQAPGTPALPAMNPGRSSITQPGGNVPGRIPRLDDIPWKR
jgi:hypothetical protein